LQDDPEVISIKRNIAEVHAARGASENLAGALNDLGTLYMAQGRYDDAEAHLNRAEALLAASTLSMDLWHAAVLLNLARLYRIENKVEEADVATSRATEIMRDTEWGRRTPEKWI
jgi:tetratricopeptide (TPR) repeat protein